MNRLCAHCRHGCWRPGPAAAKEPDRWGGLLPGSRSIRRAGPAWWAVFPSILWGMCALGWMVAALPFSGAVVGSSHSSPEEGGQLLLPCSHRSGVVWLACWQFCWLHVALVCCLAIQAFLPALPVIPACFVCCYLWCRVTSSSNQFPFPLTPQRLEGHGAIAKKSRTENSRQEVSLSWGIFCRCPR